MPTKNLRLFGVKNARTNELVWVDSGPAYFDNKEEAKELRDEAKVLSGELFAITLGPDHDRFRRVG